MKTFYYKIFALLVFAVSPSVLIAQYATCALASSNPVTLADPTANSCAQWLSNSMNLSTGPLATDGFPGGDCGTGTPVHNYWISFIMPPNSVPNFILQIERISTGAGCSPNDQTKLGVNVYTGTCGSLIDMGQKDCSLCGGTECTREPFSSSAYTPGSKVFLQIYNNNDLNCDFKLKIETSPAFDNCAAATTIQTTGVYCNNGGTKLNEVISAPGIASPCSPAPNKNVVQSIDNPIWFKFTVTAASPQPYEIRMDNIICAGGSEALQMLVYKNNGSCTCGSSNLNTSSCYVACTAQEEPPLTDYLVIRPGAALPGGILPAGDYFLVIDGGSGAGCQWGFNIITLPVNFLDVSAISTGSKSAMILWRVSDQKNANHYEVEKSIDGKNFTSIGEVAAQNGTESYSFTDRHADDGIIYYRAVLYDNDNATKSYSSITNLTINAFDINVYPTLITDGLFHIKSIGEEEEYYVSIYNVLGANVWGHHFSNGEDLNNYNFQVSNWASGIYFVKVITSMGETVKKIYVNNL